MDIIDIPPATGYDSNMFLLLGRKSALIDAGTGIGSRSVVSHIADALGGSDLDMLILTHAHCDHIGGAPAIAREFGCKAYIGAGDLEAASDPSVTLHGMFGLDLAPLELLPLREGDALDLGGEALEVIETPGHTSGSICLYDRSSQDLFSGDTVFQRGVGRTDFPTGSNRQMIHSLRKLSNIQIKTVHPGHGERSQDGNASVRYAMGILGVGI